MGQGLRSNDKKKVGETQQILLGFWLGPLCVFSFFVLCKQRLSIHSLLRRKVRKFFVGFSIFIKGVEKGIPASVLSNAQVPILEGSVLNPISVLNTGLLPRSQWSLRYHALSVNPNKKQMSVTPAQPPRKESLPQSIAEMADSASSHPPPSDPLHSATLTPLRNNEAQVSSDKDIG